MSDQWSAPGADARPMVEPGRAVEVGEVIRVSGILFRNFVPLFVAHMFLGVAATLIAAPQILAQTYQVLAKPDPETQLAIAGFILVYSLFAAVVNLAISGVMVGQVRAYRQLILDPQAEIGPVDVLRIAVTRYGAILAGVFVVGAIVLAGTCLFIIPGIVASIALGQTLYLIAATDTEFGESFGKSVEIVKNNLLVLVLTYLCLGVGVLALYLLVYGGIAALGTALFGFEIGLQVFTPPVFQLVLLPITFFVSVPFQALSIAMEAAYSGIAIPERD